MIGTELVSLQPASGTVYEEIAADIMRSPDRDLWYGPLPSWKGARQANTGNAAAVALPLIFAAIAMGLFIDAFGDTASAWNPWNAVWFAVLMAALVIGLITASIALKPNDRNWKRHPLIVRLGDRVNIGIGDIWHDAANGICVLDCSLLEAFRGKGLGAVATRMMIRKCFAELGARRLESSTLSTNPRALKMNDRMIEEGILRQRYVIRGQPVDEHLYRLLRTEWDAQLQTRQATSALPSA